MMCSGGERMATVLVILCATIMVSFVALMLTDKPV
jgi:hypothetical protein